MRLREWLSSGGGAGETPHQLLHILANRAGFRAAVPLSVEVGVKTCGKGILAIFYFVIDNPRLSRLRKYGAVALCRKR